MRRMMVQHRRRVMNGFGDDSTTASGVTSTSSIDATTDPTDPVTAAVTDPTVTTVISTPSAGSMDVRLQLPVAFTFTDAQGGNRPWISLAAGLAASYLLYKAIKKSSL